MHTEGGMTTATKIRERPIAFSPEMIGAILGDRKTATRRIVDPQDWQDGKLKVRLPRDVHGDAPVFHKTFAPAGDYQAFWNPYGAVSVIATNGRKLGVKPDEFQWLTNRYGTVGDHLWVKEALRPSAKGTVVYAQDGCPAWHGTESVKWSWKPKTLGAMYMPRWASRIGLEITGIRIERLKEMRAADVVAEGFPFSSDLDQFKTTWNRLNSKRGYSWESNPFVFVIEFKRIK